MRIWAFRFSFKRIAAVSAVLTAVVFAAVCGAVLRAERRDVFDGSTTDRRIEFLLSRGIEADPVSETAREITIPAVFDEVYIKYAGFQSSQGFALEHYAGERAGVYSYAVTNAPNNRGDIRANLLTYEGTVIGFEVYDSKESSYYCNTKSKCSKS